LVTREERTYTLGGPIIAIEEWINEVQSATRVGVGVEESNPPSQSQKWVNSDQQDKMEMQDQQ